MMVREYSWEMKMAIPSKVKIPHQLRQEIATTLSRRCASYLTAHFIHLTLTIPLPGKTMYITEDIRRDDLQTVVVRTFVADQLGGCPY